jgi:uncharacterized protein
VIRRVDVDTPMGPARAHVHEGMQLLGPDPEVRTTLVLGHGAGGGVGAADLAAIAAELPPAGVTVVLVEQPWRVAGKHIAGRPAGLDQAWVSVLADPEVRAATGLTGGARLVTGGRSAGARVACRTAATVGAFAVVALAFPLHPPGRGGNDSKGELSRAGELLAAGVPTLVVQGERDSFGQAAEFPAGRPHLTVVGVPYADHSFTVPRRLAAAAGLAPTYAVDLVVAHVRTFLADLTG